MSKLIEKYIYDVVRRLPEREQFDVRRELEANIYDMLGDRDDEEEDAVKTVLYELGSPVTLAEKYRLKPRYLISPAMYEQYIRVLKMVLPIVGGVMLVIGGILGGLDGFGNPYSITTVERVISSALEMGVSSVIQALLWITVGFVIAERKGKRANIAENWKLENLPEIPPQGKKKISFIDITVELVLCVIFSIIALLICTGKIPPVFSITINENRGEALMMFTADFLGKCIPVILINMLFQAAESAVKIKFRMWEPIVCIAVIVNNIVSVVSIFFLISLNMFHGDFLNFVQKLASESDDFGNLLNHGSSNPLLAGIAGIVIIAALVDTGIAVYRTFVKKYNNIC